MALNKAKRYVDSMRGRMLYKVECYDGTFSLKCRICALVDHTESVVLVDAMTLGDTVKSTVKGVCLRCTVCVYIHHAHDANFELYYHSGGGERPVRADSHPLALRQLYRVLVLRFHPDKAGQGSAADFRRVYELYKQRDYEALLAMYNSCSDSDSV